MCVRVSVCKCGVLVCVSVGESGGRGGGWSMKRGEGERSREGGRKRVRDSYVCRRLVVTVAPARGGIVIAGRGSAILLCC